MSVRNQTDGRKAPPFPGTTGRRDWKTAFDAIKKLLANGDDTTQVFRIMRALNVGNAPMNYAKFIATAEGGRMAYERHELAQIFSQPGYARQFAPGTVGAAYNHFLESTGYSADGLAEVVEDQSGRDDAPSLRLVRAAGARHARHLARADRLQGRREPGRSGVGRVQLCAGRRARLGVHRRRAALKSRKVTGNNLFMKAVWEGYKRGKKAKWISGEDYEQLLHEPLDAARQRLGLGEPVAYLKAQRELGELASYMSAPKADAPASPRSSRPEPNSARASAMLSRLVLTDFRNHAEAVLHPGRGFVVLTGDNGAGKTNVLEAVSLLAPGRGLRRAALSDMARQGGRRRVRRRGDAGRGRRDRHRHASRRARAPHRPDQRREPSRRPRSPSG